MGQCASNMPIVPSVKGLGSARPEVEMAMRLLGASMILLVFVAAFVVLAKREGWRLIAKEFAVVFVAAGLLGVGTFLLLAPEAA